MWDPIVIKAELIKRGSSLSQAGIVRGLSDSACRKALTQRLPNAEKAIAEEIGVSVTEIFPERYEDKVAQ